MSGRDREPLLSETPPLPEQLRRLSMIGVRSAVGRDRLMHLKRLSRAHFFVDEIEALNEANMPDSLTNIRHIMAGRIGIRESQAGNPKQWSLKYSDTFWVQQPDDDTWRAERTIYRFEWDRLRVTMAQRAIRIIGDNINYDPDVSVEDTLERTFIPVYSTDMLHLQQEMELVTYDDCDELIKEAKDYFSSLDVQKAHTLGT
jgi:hypothetical protein